MMFVDGKVNFSLINSIVEKLRAHTFCEVYDMVDMNTMLSDPAFAHRNRTKKQVMEDSNDRLKHSRVEIDTFGQVRNMLSGVRGDGVYKYKVGHSRKVPNYGRLYDSCYRLMAYVQERIRSVAMKGMVEIDQKGCHPRNLVRLYTETFHEEPVAAKQLVTDKEAFVREALQHYKLNDNDKNRKQIKAIVLAITYGGSISSVFEAKHGSKKKEEKALLQSDAKKFQDHNGKWVEMPLLKRYKDEVKKVIGVIEEYYPEVFKAVYKDGITAHDHKTRTLSYVLQSMETAVSALAVLYMIDKGLLGDLVDGAYRMSFLHDGFYVLESP